MMLRDMLARASKNSLTEVSNEQLRQISADNGDVQYGADLNHKFLTATELLAFHVDPRMRPPTNWSEILDNEGYHGLWWTYTGGKFIQEWNLEIVWNFYRFSCERTARRFRELCDH